jgi:hypothetical protein
MKLKKGGRERGREQRRDVAIDKAEWLTRFVSLLFKLPDLSFPFRHFLSLLTKDCLLPKRVGFA